MIGEIYKLLEPDSPSLPRQLPLGKPASVAGTLVLVLENPLSEANLIRILTPTGVELVSTDYLMLCQKPQKWEI